jgi:sister chromatid cohesion protein DCC1
VTLEELRNTIQASDAELEVGLRNAKVLNLNGKLRPLPASSLADILVTALLTIASRGLPRPPRPIPLRELTTHLEDDFQVAPAVMEQVAGWYGVVSGEGKGQMWEADVKAIVADIGIGMLRRSNVSDLSGVHRSDRERNISGAVGGATISRQLERASG